MTAGQIVPKFRKEKKMKASPCRVVMAGGVVKDQKAWRPLAPMAPAETPVPVERPATNQSKAFATNFRRVAFQECGNCGTKGQMFVPYYPELVGFCKWCYTCGAKDGECQKGGASLHNALLDSISAMEPVDARAALIDAIVAKRRALLDASDA